jgi:hypothetical protein
VIQDPDAAELFKTHLRKWEENLPCPICKTDAWEVGGPLGYSVSDQVEPKPGELARRPGMFPVAFMICSTCGFVRHFAWVKVRRPTESNG